MKYRYETRRVGKDKFTRMIRTRVVGYELDGEIYETVSEAWLHKDPAKNDAPSEVVEDDDGS